MGSVSKTTSPKGGTKTGKSAVSQTPKTSKATTTKTPKSTTSQPRTANYDPRPSVSSGLAATLKKTAMPVKTAPASATSEAVRAAAAQKALLNIKGGLGAEVNRLEATARQNPQAKQQLQHYRQQTRAALDPVGTRHLLQQLPAWLRAQFDALSALLGTDDFARLALHFLLRDGKLTPELMQALTNLSKQPLGPGVDRAKLLASVLHELAVPGNIKQGSDSSCVAVGAATDLAIKNPAEYVRVLAGLASPEGSVQLAGGQRITRQPLGDDPSRTLSQQLLIPALMDAVAPEGLRFDGARGFYVLPDGRPADATGQPVSEDDALRTVSARGGRELLTMLLGTEHRTIDLGIGPPPDPFLQQALADETLRLATPASPMQVTLDSRVAFPGRGFTGRHNVSVIGRDADGNVLVVDPQATDNKPQVIPLWAFKGSLLVAHYEAGQLTPATEASLQSWVVHDKQRLSPREQLEDLIREVLGGTDGGDNDRVGGGGGTSLVARVASELLLTGAVSPAQLAAGDLGPVKLTVATELSRRGFDMTSPVGGPPRRPFP